MGERDDAKRAIDQARTRMSQAVDELARRTSSESVLRQTKEAAVKKTNEWSDRARKSPVALGLLGGALGASIGAAMASRKGREDRRLGEGRVEEYTRGELEEPLGGVVPGAEEPSVSERASHAVDTAREKTAQAADTAREKAAESKEALQRKARESYATARGKASQLRERAPSRDEMRGYFRRAVDEQPAALSLGAILVGMIAGYLIPETSQERRAMGRLKDRVREQAQRAESRIDETLEKSVQSEEREPRPAGPRFPEEGTTTLH